MSDRSRVMNDYLRGAPIKNQQGKKGDQRRHDLLERVLGGPTPAQARAERAKGDGLRDAEREAAIADRDAAVAEREAARRERDAATAQREAAERELDGT